MRVLLAGPTGAIGRPLIRGLKQHGHSVFGLVRSTESTNEKARHELNFRPRPLEWLQDERSQRNMDE